MRLIRVRQSDPRAAAAFEPRSVLYWIYAGRLIVCIAVYGTALLLGNVWASGAGLAIPQGTRVISILGLLLAGLTTPPAYWYSHRRKRRELSRAFLYGQAALDIVLATGVVHITGGSGTAFPPLFYVLLASGYALLLPLGSAVVIALGTGLAYLLDVALAFPGQLDARVLLQILIFTLVASVTSVIGVRLRRVGQELRSIERELRRLRLDTTDVLRSLSSGVLTLDEEGRLAYINPIAEQMLGILGSDWAGRSVVPELTDRAPELVTAVFETLYSGLPVEGRELELNLEPEAELGSLLPVAVSAVLLKRPASPPAVTLVLQDLRTVRQLEELRIRTGRLEAVAELSASLAHEIRNPLTAIRSAVEQLAADLPDPATAGEGPGGVEAQLTRLVLRESERLSRLLGEFSDFARVDVTTRRPIQLEKLVREAVELVSQHPASVDRATFETTVEEGIEDLWGDSDLLHRTLTNLMLNAVQVSEPAEVRVRIAVDTFQPRTFARTGDLGRPVRIRVTDDGPGIDPEDLEHIFDPFFTRRKGGTGMGLSIAHRAIQAHGGALLVSSSLGEGATFAIVLPRRERERPVTRTADAETGTGGLPEPEALQEALIDTQPLEESDA